MQASLPLDGRSAGPLFEPIRKVKPPVSAQSGGKRIWAKWTRATPPWADKLAIKNVYRLAKELTLETGTTHSVDHIVPLLNPFVCGLHVECNLAVMPLAENIKKSNTRWPDMWGQQGELL